MTQGQNDKIPVACYGIHKDDNEVLWILQRATPKVQNIYGLLPIDCGVEVVAPGLTSVHAFDIRRTCSDELYWAYLELFQKSELVRLLSPIPNKNRIKAAYISVKSSIKSWVLSELLMTGNYLITPHKDIRLLFKISERIPFLNILNSSNLAKAMVIVSQNTNQEDIENLLNSTVGSEGTLLIVGPPRRFFGSLGSIPHIEYDDSIEDFLSGLSKLSDLKLLGNRIVKEVLSGNEIFT